jgi:non-specific serine/threonine protein kinase/serine/threonine-protein kinase
LGDHCAEVERRHGLPVRLSLADADGPFPPDVALGLYRVAQEALANAVRHAGARTARVTLTVAAGAARLAVADDGAGFDPAAARRAGGLGLASVEERARLLGGRCRVASAPGAGAEVEVTVPLPDPAAPESAADPPAAGASPVLRTVGPYRLLDEIGGGASATVWLAEEPPPLGRRVALKLHRGPLPGRRETLRFKAEREALARLHHPAIARVYEARATEEGDPYIVMEYVPGLPITAYCDRYALDLDRRLALFAAVCAGVEHAHRNGVLHRDLKPANILVMEEGGRPRPKIVDFGVAKGLDRPLAEGTVWSAEELVGTPAYLAPEILGGADADTRADVYALGVLLYELLVGTVPIAADERGIAGLAEWAGAVRRGEAPAPSRRLAAMPAAAAAAAARCRGFGSASRLGRRLRGDLDRMALKALAPDPAARYPTVDALAAEVGRALRGEPVEAGPPGALHQLGRLARRHRRLAAATALVIGALAAGLVATAVQARRAEREAARADAVARFLEELFQAADPRRAKGEPPDARELLRRGAERLGGELADQPRVRARLLDTLGGIDTELGLYDEARPLLEGALALRERLRGGDLEVAATLVRLGRLARLSGRGDAEALLRRALAIREDRLGPDHPEVADLLGELGTTLAARGRFDEGEALLERALAIDERRGRDDPRTAKVLHNLSGIAYYRGRAAEAERLLRRALAIRAATLAADDPDLAGSREALALLLREQGRPAEAVALLEPLAATAERFYGPDHPDLARALVNLGLARKDLGEPAAARRLLERAVAIAEGALAPDHPMLLRALVSLADLHFEQGRLAEAEALYRRLAALREAGASASGGDEWLANWARLLAATGREKEAAEVESGGS